ncbi:uncharacterized protein F4807DRAFT_130874 [Annulohypoxylon truncatum]|uniref:uncharacterized protein n=1 Tax=Annulohypoxylon truncatum TaxID=327061 RepID=UPI002008BF66|nr:uncharacterized protein F4807DRAFT_130874 [Annulohypoxylon truncatum]KAI1208709.1 hypothetical protein F4807DRAFT_130874 [Annulohypoxylon truncatum]
MAPQAPPSAARADIRSIAQNAAGSPDDDDKPRANPRTAGGIDHSTVTPDFLRLDMQTPTPSCITENNRTNAYGGTRTPGGGYAAAAPRPTTLQDYETQIRKYDEQYTRKSQKLHQSYYVDNGQVSDGANAPRPSAPAAHNQRPSPNSSLWSDGNPLANGRAMGMQNTGGISNSYNGVARASPSHISYDPPAPPPAPTAFHHRRSSRIPSWCSAGNTSTNNQAIGMQNTGGVSYTGNPGGYGQASYVPVPASQPFFPADYSRRPPGSYLWSDGNPLHNGRAMNIPGTTNTSNTGNRAAAPASTNANATGGFEPRTTVAAGTARRPSSVNATGSTTNVSSEQRPQKRRAVAARESTPQPGKSEDKDGDKGSDAGGMVSPRVQKKDEDEQDSPVRKGRDK